MKLIILDRDGVINYDSPDYIKSAEEWLPINSSIHAIARLHQAGYTVAVATNQSGVGRGYFSHEILTAIHQKMLNTVKAAGGHIDKITLCPHTPDARCTCRKPQPGLLQEISKHYECSLDHIAFVGDSLKDIQAAQRAGCQPILVKTGNGLKTLQQLEPNDEIQVYEDLADYVEKMLSSRARSARDLPPI